MEWPDSPGRKPLDPPYAAACAGMGATFVAIPVAIGARLNDAPTSFWLWFAGGVALAIGLYGLVWLIDHVASSERTAAAPPPPVDDWSPAFTEEEYAKIRKKVPFAGIWDSGGPGYSDYSERVDEILYGKTSSGPPSVAHAPGAAAAVAMASRPAPPRRRSAAR